MGGAFFVHRAGAVVLYFFFLTNPAHSAFVDDPVYYERLKEDIPSGVRFAMSAMPVNGDFSGGLANWSTTGDVSAISGEAALRDQVAPTTLLYQPVPLAPGTYVLTFDVRGSLAPNPGPGFFPDTFFASLYFTTNPATFDIASSQFDAVVDLVDLDAGGFTVHAGSIGPSPSGAQWTRHTLLFSSAFAYVVPAFELADIDGTKGNSQVLIDNVLIVPEPATLALAALGLAALALRRLRGTLLFALAAFAMSAFAQSPFSLKDHFVVRTANERSTLDRQTGDIISTVDVTMMNLGGREVRSPLHAVLNLSTGGVQAIGALGGSATAPYNRYYVDLSSQLPLGRLTANESVSFSLVFRRNRNTAFSYELEPYGLLKQERTPTVAAPPGPFTVNEGGSLQIPVTANDPDGDIVVLSAAPAISNATFVGNPGVSPSGMLTFGPDFDQAGFYTIQFAATDPLGLSSSTSIVIEVRNVNRGPVLGAMAPRSVREGELLRVDLPASDPDDDPLDIVGTPLPPNAVVIPQTKTFVFAPDFTQSGSYTVLVEVSDGPVTGAAQALRIDVEDVAIAAPGDTNLLTLVVDPIQSPTLATRQRVTGAINAGTNAAPRPQATAGLITGLSPAVLLQGQTADIVIEGQGSGVFAIDFGPGSAPLFGPGITVNAVTVSNAALLVANVTVATDAPTGARAVSVQTGDETAFSIVALNISAGLTSITGRLVNAETTNAIAGAIVAVAGTPFRTTTGPDGSFVLNGLPPGDYELIVNPPNHELLRFRFTVRLGVATDLGVVATPPTVFDPSAPAGVSLMSVIGRGVTSFTVSNREQARQAIQDALILVGGSEGGVVDAFGNQLNPDLSGPGLISITQEGLDGLVDRVERGDSVALSDLLMPLTFSFEWTNGPALTLADWMEALQQTLDQAWVSPTVPENSLPILLFGGGKTIGPRPPILAPDMRLNPVQAYLFLGSLVAFAEDPLGTNVFADTGRRWGAEPVLATAVRGWSWGELFVTSARGDPPPPGGGRRMTSYWRGFAGLKGNLINNALAAGVQSYVTLMGLAAADVMLSARGGLGGAVVSLGLNLAVIGRVADVFHAAFVGAAMSARVPEPPEVVSAEIVGRSMRVLLKPSRNDQRNGKYVYALYRFRDLSEGRQLAGLGVSTNSADAYVDIRDFRPTIGSFFYAATCSYLYDIEGEISPALFNVLTPWWNLPQTFSAPFQVLAASRQILTSDYSDPLLAYFGTAAASIPISDIEVHPVTADVYYSVKSTNTLEQRILRIGNLGLGPTSVFAYTGFAAPGHEGLAMDAEGNLYSHNKGSDSRFGGRLFRYAQPDGARALAGAVNYYSPLLAFANPVDSYTLDFGPALAPSYSDQDLFVVEMLSGEVRRAPVKAPDSVDGFRRVAQPYAALPVSGRPIDMEHDEAGNTYLLMADAAPRQPFNDREKGPMHIPKGAPLRNPCPPDSSNIAVDPVYLHSGEFYEDVTDIAIKGRGLDFVWARKYRSKIGTNTVQGNHWDYSYNIYIEQNTNTGGVIVHDGNTRADEYARSGTNDLWTLREFFRELRRNPDGTYALQFEDRGEWQFHGFTGAPEDGRIRASTDRTGNTLSFFYDGVGRLNRVNDTLGRDILIAYNPQGLVSTITDFAGRTWRYEYYGPAEAGGSEGDLKAAVTPVVVGTPTGNDFPAGKRVSYTYSKGYADPRLNGNLLTITDGKGQTYLDNTYATNANPDDLLYDRIVAQRWGNATDTVELHYEAVNPVPANGGAIVRVILNDRVGNVQEYFYNDRSQCTIERRYTGRARNNEVTTATRNRPVGRLRASDPEYFETRYEWNADSLKRREVHPNGNITEWVYEGDLDPLAPARTRGNVREIRHLPGTHTPVGDQPQIVETFEYDTSFGRGCCGFNHATVVRDGRGNETRSYYDSSGNLTAKVERIGSIRTDYEYNAFGQLTKTIHPDNGSGHRRQDALTYYAAGPQRGYVHQSIVDAGGLNLATTFEHDAVGNVIRTIDPKGNDLLHTVNSLDQVVRVLSREVRAGTGIRYATDTYYDANDNVVRIDLPNLDDMGQPIAGNPVLTTTKEYDILNMVLRETVEVDPARNVTTEYAYDGNRNRVLTRFGEAVNGNQPLNTVHTEYDERDLVFRTTSAKGDPAQSTTQFDYDRNGNTIAMRSGIEGEARVRTYVHDAYDRKVLETDPMGNEIRIEYNENNRPVRIAVWGETNDIPGGAGNVLLSETVSHLDAMDRVTNSIATWFVAGSGPVGDGQVVATTSYTDLSAASRTVDDRGNVRTFEYDGAGRLLRETDAASNVTAYVYDLNGNPVRVEATERPSLGGPPVVFVVSNEYDQLDRLVRTVDSGGNARGSSFDSRGNVIAMTGGRGNVVRAQFDGLNRPIRSVRELREGGTGAGALVGEIVGTMTWDDSSRLLEQTDGLTNATAYAYDALGRKIQATMADGTISRVAYDVHGNAITNIDANGTVVRTAYDVLNRTHRIEVAPGPGVSGGATFEQFTYDGLSRVIRAEDDDDVVVRAYDSLSRLVREDLNGRVTEFTYDGVGNLSRVGYPGGRAVSNSFDTLNRLQGIADAAGAIADVSFLGPQRVDRIDYGNGTRLAVAYDAARRATNTLHVRDPLGVAAVIDARSSTWDADHNRARRIHHAAGYTETFEYDSANRLVRSDSNLLAAIRYVLDPAGNRLSVTGGPRPGVYMRDATTPVPADRQVHQYTATSFDARRYDAKGNLLRINEGQPDERRFTYDYRNRLSRYENASTGVEVEFSYDAFGRRTRKSVSGPGSGFTGYVYDHAHRVIEEVASNGTVQATYVYGAGADERISMSRGGSNYVFHVDDLGSVVKVTDSAGQIVESYEYADYGEPTIRNGAGAVITQSAIGNPYRFTGREYDPETGLYFYRARYMDPLAGRFISRDPAGIWGDAENLGNPLAYVGNNPGARIDPSGNIGEALFARIGQELSSPLGRVSSGTFSALAAWGIGSEILRSQRCWEPFRWNYAAGKVTAAGGVAAILFGGGRAAQGFAQYVHATAVESKLPRPPGRKSDPPTSLMTEVYHNMLKEKYGSNYGSRWAQREWQNARQLEHWTLNVNLGESVMGNFDRTVPRALPQINLREHILDSGYEAIVYGHERGHQIINNIPIVGPISSVLYKYSAASRVGEEFLVEFAATGSARLAFDHATQLNYLTIEGLLFDSAAVFSGSSAAVGLYVVTQGDGGR